MLQRKAALSVVAPGEKAATRSRQLENLCFSNKTSFLFPSPSDNKIHCCVQRFSYATDSRFLTRALFHPPLPIHTASHFEDYSGRNTLATHYSSFGSLFSIFAPNPHELRAYKITVITLKIFRIRFSFCGIV